MESFYLKDLIQAINGKFIRGNLDLPVIGISVDSRTIKKGEVYFAIQGNHYDGHDFIKESIAKGASAIVYSESEVNSVKILSNSFSVSMVKTDNTLIALGELAKTYINRFKNIQTVGITGSNGKTTSKEILVSIFSKKAKTLSNKNNFNNRIGLPLSVLNLTSNVKYAVFEMGTSLYGEIKILSDIVKPNVGIITNIGLSHLKTFISPKGVFKEKKVLFGNVKEDGAIIVNNDDKFLKKICKVKNSRKVITFACDADADMCAKNIMLSFDKINFELFYNKKSVKIKMSMKGKFNVSNALAAAACAVSFGFSLDEIKYGIENFKPPEMRMETIVTKKGVILVNDAYNANPSSMQETIQAVSRHYIDRKINLVLGDMLELGNKSIDYHFELGKFINTQKNIDSVYLIGEMSFYTKMALVNKNVFHTKETGIILQKLNQILVDHTYVFLFKASRSMKLEEIYVKFHKVIKQRSI
ncbi:MAG: UDP-N-acetylmuramoyl-tripeptide--D-alanyl-D-alanine ligase [Endomicrobium sp.]|jgi:UDP-N-acetylmuramoyl-tripeptide--D-alanyl-D-alanine ligase|nr:UDP-N-acetylmuramoyl-tripeptide--D-alanyl-D-alanine ligase [Endomicrobium sp.]